MAPPFMVLVFVSLWYELCLKLGRFSKLSFAVLSILL